MKRSNRLVLLVGVFLARSVLAEDEGTPLRLLTDQKLAELRETLDVYRTQGLPAALEVVRSARVATERSNARRSPDAPKFGEIRSTEPISAFR